MKINEKLIWDYRFTDEERERESFREWYTARVLTRGTLEDIRGIGLQTIHDYLPRLFLPRKIRRFWEWYFSQSDVESQYGHLDSPTEKLYP